MSESFELRLKTSRVAIDKSFSVGDVYQCGNDEAWYMLQDELAELVSKKAPVAPGSSQAQTKQKQK